MGHRTQTPSGWARFALGTGLIAVPTTLGCSGDSTSHEQEPLDSVVSAVHGEGVFNDADFPESNFAVSLLGCSGTLLTPQLVLTARHCLWGSTFDNTCRTTPTLSEIRIGPDPYIPNDPTTTPTNPSYKAREWNNAQTVGVSHIAPINGCVTEDHIGSDIALVFLDEPVIDSTITNRVDNGARAVAVPRLAHLAPADPSPPSANVVVWGVAGYEGSGRRRAKLLVAVDVDTDDAGWKFFAHEHDTWSTGGGDSGGPLFFVDPSTGTRKVVGVTSGAEGDTLLWANVIASHAYSWLQNHGKEGNVDARLAHSAKWLERHGKTLDDWWGLLDYSGPCREDVDRDCDGWFDRNMPPSELHDNCFTVPNPLQEDSGDLGVGDACDPDRDGVTANYERFASRWPDNCPMAFNPGQDNCNLQFERASRLRGSSVAILGDACDPVPCPSAEVTYGNKVEFDFEKNCHVTTYRNAANVVSLTPVPPNIKTRSTAWRYTVPSGVPLPNPVPTKFRYCNVLSDPMLLTPVSCTTSDVLQNSQLREGDDDSLTAVDAEHPWQRITMLDRTTGVSRGRQDNTGFLLSYPSPTSHEFVWNYIADDNHWRRLVIDPNTNEEKQLNVVGSHKPGAKCTDTTFGPGTCLDGYLWIHAATTVGSSGATSDAVVGGVPVGTQGANLSNHIVPITPDAPMHGPGCQPYAPVCAFGICGPDRLAELWLSLTYCPNCDPFFNALAADRLRLPLINPASPTYFGLYDEMLVTAEDIGLSPDVASALAEGNFVGVQECTVTPDGSTPDGELVAVSLPTSEGGGTSRYLFANPYEPGGFLVRDSYFSSGGAPSSAASREAFGRLDAKVVYSRSHEGAFVIGGTLGGSAAETTVLFEPVDGQPEVLEGHVDGLVLAATIVGSALWTVERPSLPGGTGVSQSEVRLVGRGISQTQVYSPVFSEPITTDYTSVADYTFRLSQGCLDYGHFLLNVSSFDRSRFAVFDVDGLRAAVSAQSGSPMPVLQPLVSSVGSGTLLQSSSMQHDSLVVPVATSDDSVFIERVPRSHFSQSPPMFIGDLWTTLE